MRITVKGPGMPFKLPIIIPIRMIPAKLIQKHIDLPVDLTGFKECLHRVEKTHGSLVLVELESSEGGKIKITL